MTKMRPIIFALAFAIAIFAGAAPKTASESPTVASIAHSPITFASAAKAQPAPGTFTPFAFAAHPKVTVTFGSEVNNGDSPCTTCTYASVGIGTVTADRVVVIGVSIFVSLATDRTISGVTLGGIAMTPIASAPSSGVGGVCTTGCSTSALFSLPCPSSCINATTATVVATISGSVARGNAAGWAVTGNNGNGTPFSVGTNVTNSQTMTISSLITPPNGASIMFANDSSGNSNSCTWTASPATPATDFDAVFGTNESSGAHANSLTGVSIAPQCAFTATTVGATIAAVTFGS